MLSADVEKLYASIPIHDAINSFLFMYNIHKKQINLNQSLIPLIIDIISCVLNNNYLLYNKQCYAQISGIAEGTPLAVVIANIFLSRLEYQHKQLPSLHLDTYPLIYYRFYDDIFAIFKTHSSATNFISTLNTTHPCIKFTWEISTSQVHFMDVTIINPIQPPSLPPTQLHHHSTTTTTTTTQRKRASDFFIDDNPRQEKRILTDTTRTHTCTHDNFPLSTNPILNNVCTLRLHDLPLVNLSTTSTSTTSNKDNIDNCHISTPSIVEKCINELNQFMIENKLYELNESKKQLSNHIPTSILTSTSMQNHENYSNNYSTDDIFIQLRNNDIHQSFIVHIEHQKEKLIDTIDKKFYEARKQENIARHGLFRTKRKFPTTTTPSPSPTPTSPIATGSSTISSSTSSTSTTTTTITPTTTTITPTITPPTTTTRITPTTTIITPTSSTKYFLLSNHLKLNKKLYDNKTNAIRKKHLLTKSPINPNTWHLILENRELAHLKVLEIIVENFERENYLEKNGIIFTTELYEKPTKKINYLPPMSAHAQHIFKAIINAEINRIRMITSDDETFKQTMEIRKHRYLSKNYDKFMIEKLFKQSPNRENIINSQPKIRSYESNLIFTNKLSHKTSSIDFKRIFKPQIFIGEQDSILSTIKPLICTKNSDNLGQLLSSKLTQKNERE